MITAENAPVLQRLFNEVNKDKPAVGCTVRVFTGKHTGKIGVVKKHILSRFENPYRYGSPMSHHMLAARGRSGYAVLITSYDGETFWVPAKNVTVCCTREWE